MIPVKEDGSLEEPLHSLSPGKNTHMFLLNPTGTFAFIPCLGSGIFLACQKATQSITLLDIVAQYIFDKETGNIKPNDPPTVAVAVGTGPRHLAFHPSKPIAYLV